VGNIFARHYIIQVQDYSGNCYILMKFNNYIFLVALFTPAKEKGNARR